MLDVARFRDFGELWVPYAGLQDVGLIDGCMDACRHTDRLTDSERLLHSLRSYGFGVTRAVTFS